MALFIQILDILGTIAFSISGVLVAMNKRMDAFGVFIIAFVTAVGGGTLRDLLIGETPIFWMLDMTFVVVITISVFCAVVFRSHLRHLRKSLFFFDTVGIGLYTVIGIQKGLAVDLNPAACIILGTMSACFGGVIRDILCNEIPVIFRKEVYATACITGGVICFVLFEFIRNQQLVFLIAGLTVIILRLAAVVFKIRLPSLYKPEH